MSIPVIVQHSGVLTANPPASSSSPGTLQEVGNTSFAQTYSQKLAGSVTVTGATDMSPYALPLGTVAKVRVLYMKAIGGSVKIKLTSAAGTDQAFSTAGLFTLYTPNEGDQITAINLVGTGLDIEYFVAGD